MGIRDEAPQSRTNVVWRVTRLTRLLTGALDELLAELNVSYAQYRVLVAISRLNANSGSEIARCLGVKAPTVAGLLSNLEAAGLVERTGGTGRAVPYALTPTGQHVFDVAERRIDQLDRHLSAQLPAGGVVEATLDRISAEVQSLLTPGSIAARLARVTATPTSDPTARSLRSKAVASKATPQRRKRRSSDESAQEAS